MKDIYKENTVPAVIVADLFCELKKNYLKVLDGCYTTILFCKFFNAFPLKVIF